MGREKCALEPSCVKVKEIHNDKFNALIYQDLGEKEGCKNSEITHYANIPNIGWVEIKSETKNNCEDELLKNVQEKYETWKKQKK